MENEPENIDKTPSEGSEFPQEDQTLPLPVANGSGPSRFVRLKDWYLERKKLTIPATAVIFILLMGAIPLTRYKAAGLVLKQDFAMRVVDSTTNSPVSDAIVSAGSIQASTDGNGRAVLKGLPVGTRQVVVSKQHYKNSSSAFLIPIMDQKNTPSVSLTATGRQVTVKLVNFVTKKPLAKVGIKVADVEATTDKDGEALLVLPANASSQEATLNLAGYLNSKVKITVSNQTESEINTFSLVPSGRIYFMSKRTGKLDVMRSNIDGTDLKVVVAGTGSEQDYRTSLVPSANFEYIALQTKRSSGDPTPQLYLITDDDKLLNIDSGNAEFYIHGWSGHNLIYSLTLNDLPLWQQGKHKLKSYDATSGKITLLDQSAGSDEETAAGESYATVAITGSLVTYAKNWSGNYYGTPLTGKAHSLHAITASGQNHRMVSSYDAEKYQVQYRQRSPGNFYIYQTGDDKAYFDYQIGGQPKQVNIDEDKFYESYPSFIPSPNGQHNVWSDLRDGKDVILVGDNNGNNSKSIASLDEYGIYGWFTNDYIVLSKKNNELYVMGVDGGEPVRITGYQSVDGAYGYY